jgi:predicted NAD/FAD-dependent oxidoreductase
VYNVTDYYKCRGVAGRVASRGVRSMWQDYNINRKVRTKKSIIQTFGKILLMAVLLIILGFFFYAANDIQANGPYRP